MDISRPDLNLLVALEALLAERNVTRAAARLHLSQPALSAQLRRLREIFGDPLFVPARRGVIPTQRALELHAPLREALKALRRVVAERLHFDPSTVEFSVAIAASDYAQCALLERIVEIQREAPKLRLSWRHLYVPELVGQMERGDVDLAVMTPNTLAASNGSGGWTMPQFPAYAVQVIIAADQLRAIDVGSAITGMSLRQGSASTSVSFPVPATALPRFDVTISPAANGPLSMSNSFASNIGPGAVSVRSGAMPVPENAYPASGSAALPSENAWYVPFSRAYVYTGGDLCVTIRGEGVLGGSSAYFDGEGNSPSARGASRYVYGDANASAGSAWGPPAVRFAFTARAFCPWDLNNDGIVADDDFPIFVNAYNILDCTSGAMPQG